jgi:putative ATPase
MCSHFSPEYPRAYSPYSVFVFERLTDSDIERIVLQGSRRIFQTEKPIDLDKVDDDDVFSDPNVPSSQDAPGSQDSSSSVKKQLPQLSQKVLGSLVSLADGDARTALSLLALVLGSSPDADEGALLTALRQSTSTSYDRTGDSHYDMISALHKSVRGSEGSAAMYWLARMLTAGEDPVYVARRMVVCASEDIGLADNAALPLVGVRLFPVPGFDFEPPDLGDSDPASVPKRRHARMSDKPRPSRCVPFRGTQVHASVRGLQTS